MTNADGKTEILVGSSEGVLRPAQREALLPGEAAIKGVPGTHAEVNVIDAAASRGETVTAIAASRPICTECEQAIRNAGAEIASPIKRQ